MPAVERVAYLAEDLALAGDQRVETGGDPEEVERGRLVGEAVERAARARRVAAGEREELLGRAAARSASSSAAR